MGATAVEERWLIDEQLAWVRGLQVPELLLCTHNTVPETKKAICTHAGGVYITWRCLVCTEHPEILFILRTAARDLLLEDHCGDSALWPQPESEFSLAEHSLSFLCTARQGRAEMDRQSQAPARAELRALFASTTPALGATSGLGCLPLLEAQRWRPLGQVRTCLDYCGGLAELSKVTDSWLTWPSVAYNIQLHRGNWKEASLFYFLNYIFMSC